MSSSICFTPLSSFKPINKPGVTGNFNVRKFQWLRDGSVCKDAKLRCLEIKATESNQTSTSTENNRTTKVNSILCRQCEGNGTVKCTQCQGTGVNSVDHFNGRFKAGGLCWLCRGKRDILCGECNGAGFLGGIMSSAED